MYALVLFVLNIICHTLLHHNKLFQMICCTPALHQAILKDLHIIAAHHERCMSGFKFLMNLNKSRDTELIFTGHE